MAGSFKHVTTDDGKLISPEKFPSMIENLGDAYEAIEEMYGMIWTLADDIANGESGAAADPKLYVQGAADAYQRGLDVARLNLGDHDPEATSGRSVVVVKVMFQSDDPDNEVSTVIERLKETLTKSRGRNFTIRHATTYPAENQNG